MQSGLNVNKINKTIKKQCFFCENTKVIVTTLKDNLDNDIPICHCCYNKATRCDGGLVFENKKIVIT